MGTSYAAIGKRVLILASEHARPAAEKRQAVFGLNCLGEWSIRDHVNCTRHVHPLPLKLA
jgi:hypothetical protein